MRKIKRVLAGGGVSIEKRWKRPLVVVKVPALLLLQRLDGGVLWLLELRAASSEARKHERDHERGVKSEKRF